MKETMETPSPAPSNTGWDELSEVPFAGNTNETPPEKQDDSDDELYW